MPNQPVRAAAPRDPWRRSLRRSRERRALAARLRRRRRIGRGGSTALAAAMTLLVGGAVAHETQRASSRASAPATARILKLGSSGAAVAALQRALGVAADGDFGPVTRRAVLRFQRSRGLAADGVAGPATLGALGLTRVRQRTAAPRARDAATVLARIAACESGGNPRAVSANGRYRGKYQFTRATWRWLGGTGDPARASEAEQDRLAAKLYALRGTAPWPNCARRL